MTNDRFELTSIPLVKKILASRWLQWSLVTAMLPFFVLAILTGLFGTPSGSRNFGIVFVWIVWWALLMLLLVPFAGRLWCAICPIPAPGEWLQRRALVQVRPGAKLFTLGWKWPRALNNIWLQNAAFLAVALFSKVILTSPFISAIVLALFALVALALSLVFERRTFCRYLCPVGGFIGLYSQVAPIELRVKDHAVCATHKEKTCYVGSDKGYGCPWLVFPATLDKNTYCGLCTECLKTCPLDNIALYARPFGKDLQTNKGRRLDEAFRGLIMLTTAPLYMIVFMGPWATIKEAAYTVGSPSWWVFALTMIGATLVIIPGIFYACAALANVIASRDAAKQSPIRKLEIALSRSFDSATTLRLAALAQGVAPLRTLLAMTNKFFIDYAYVLVPLGLAAWAAFSVSFVLMNMSYAWQVLSDPFGWGWNLFGTADWKWTPYFAGWQGLMQVPILLAGLFGAIGVAFNTAREQHVPQRVALPIVGFCVAFTIAMLWLNL